MRLRGAATSQRHRKIRGFVVAVLICTMASEKQVLADKGAGKEDSPNRASAQSDDRNINTQTSVAEGMTPRPVSSIDDGCGGCRFRIRRARATPTLFVAAQRLSGSGSFFQASIHAVQDAVLVGRVAIILKHGNARRLFTRQFPHSKSPPNSFSIAFSSRRFAMHCPGMASTIERVLAHAGYRGHDALTDQSSSSRCFRNLARSSPLRVLSAILFQIALASL